MSVCTFLAADVPLTEISPSQEYPVHFNVDEETVYDGDADDNFFLYPFADVTDYTKKSYGVQLEWNYYTEGRAKKIIEYIKEVLQAAAVVELWHAWIPVYEEYEESPVFKKKEIKVAELTAEKIKEWDELEIWNHPDKNYPDRPSFYCLTIQG